jgi:hypothetical protein
MSHLEDQLRSALHRQDPPPGFAARVLATTTARPLRRARLWWPAATIAAAVAAGVMVVSVSTATYQHRREERAGRQAIAALQIAVEKLNLARDQALGLDALPADTPAGAEAGSIDNSSKKDN